jgi:hypothetical protein
MKILEMSQDGIEAEQTNEGTVAGKYSGKRWDTVELQMNRDGTSKLSVKFIQMTSKGMVFGIGQGTSVRPSAR